MDKDNLQKIKHKHNKVEIDTGFTRIGLVKAFIIGIFGLIVVRLFYIQVIHNKDYKDEASLYQEAVETTVAKRGEIYVLANKNVDIASMKTYNYSNIDQLDKIAANVYKYNIIFNPRALFNYKNLSETLISYLGKKVDANKNDIEELFISFNDPYEISERIIEIVYPDLYKYAEYEAEFNKWKTEKESLESKLKITKNEKTKKELENSLYIVNMSLNDLPEDFFDKIDELNKIRESIVSKISKENDAYEIIKRDISEEQKDALVTYFQDSIIDQFSYYILQLDSESKVNQIKNIYKAFVTFEQNNSRTYTDSSIFSQITGFVKTKEETNGEKYNEGEYGVEGYYNVDLTGKNGVIKGTYDRNGKLIATAEKTVEEAVNGESLVLTIDKSIQYNVCKELQNAVDLYEAENGSVIVMNPNTGEILSMCNVPSFDSNNFGKVDDIAVYNNPIVSDQVEFGSIMKVMTIAAGIDTGAINAYSTYEDTGCAIIGDWPKPICNSDYKTKGAYGETDMVTVLDKSLNLGSWYVANKIGKDNFKSYVDKFGFGKKTGVDLGNEAKGDLRNLDKITNKGGDVYLATASFGQGITMTQLQYITAFSSIINGGNLMKPYIVKATIDNEGNVIPTEPVITEKTIKESTSTTMRGMLTSVVEKGYDKSAQVEGYYIGGKTGTAQFAENGAYGDKTIQSFVGFGPVSDPKFAILIKLTNPATDYASYSCTPVFFNIAKYLFDYYQIPPDKIN